MFQNTNGCKQRLDGLPLMIYEGEKKEIWVKSPLKIIGA